MGPGRRSDQIDDDEVLYRRVLPKDIQPIEGGHRIGSQAFTDRLWEPSVDRAILRNHRPVLTQGEPSFAVISVKARQVRAIALPLRNEAGQETMVRPFDVRYKPTDENPAHAE